METSHFAQVMPLIPSEISSMNEIADQGKSISRPSKRRTTIIIPEAVRQSRGKGYFAGSPGDPIRRLAQQRHETGEE